MVDAVIVLCGGVLTGIVSACELLDQLALHRVLPSIFLRFIPLTGSPYISVLSFMTFSMMLYASAGASLTVISGMFSLVWLTVMSLFPISLLLLKFNRERLPRARKTSFFILMVTLILAPVVFAGNIAVHPRIIEYAFPLLHIRYLTLDLSHTGILQCISLAFSFCFSRRRIKSTFCAGYTGCMIDIRACTRLMQLVLGGRR